MKNFRLPLMVAALAIGFTPAASIAQVAGSARLPTTQGDLQVIALGYRTSKLLKSNVYNLDGKRIGEVEDIIITQNAAVSFFILEVGGFLHIGQKDVAVPARAFRIVNKKLVLPNLSADDLKKLPAFKFSKL